VGYSSLPREKIIIIIILIIMRIVWAEHALDLVTEIGRRIATVTHDPRSTMFLDQRLSVAVQRGNARCVLGTFTNNFPCNQY